MENNAVKKKQLVIIAGALGLLFLMVIFGIMSVTSEEPQVIVEQSAIQQGRDQGVTPRQGKVSELPPAYQESMREYDKQKKVRAENDESVLASMPIFNPTEEPRVNVEPDDPAKEAELERQAMISQAAQRVIYEEAKKPRKVYHPEDYEIVITGYSDVINGFIKREPTTSLASNSVVNTFEDIELANKYAGFARPAASSQQPQVNSGGSTGAVQQTVEDLQKQVRQMYPTKAGDLLYSYTINQIDTAAKVPVIVEISSGPLRKSRFIGEPTLVNKKAMIKFTRAETPDGLSLEIQAAAVRMEDVGALIEGEYDGVYWQRFGLPGLAALISGTSQSANEILQNQGRVTTQGPLGGITSATPPETISSAVKKGAFGGIAEAGKTIADEIKREAKESIPSVRIEANQPLAILMFSSVRVSPGSVANLTRSPLANVGQIPNQGLSASILPAGSREAAINR